MPYLCKCYPENNLFTLKKLIPIEDEAVAWEGHRFFVGRHEHSPNRRMRDNEVDQWSNSISVWSEWWLLFFVKKAKKSYADDM